MCIVFRLSYVQKTYLLYIRAIETNRITQTPTDDTAIIDSGIEKLRP